MTSDRNQLRPYGPGKFNALIDSYVYDLSLNGPDDSAGDVQENGRAYSLLRGAFKLTGSFVDFVPEVINELTAEERQLLTTTAGVIISEDDQGFVSVDYYDSAEELDRAWQAIEDELNPQDEDDSAAYDEQIDPNEARLIALGFDRGAAGCSQCQALSINGRPCHETGCSNARHDCAGCNALIPVRQRYCEDCR